MRILLPHNNVKKVTDITLEILSKLNVKAIFLDVDNTLCSYADKVPIEGAIKWVESLKKAGYEVYIVSNNYKKRVSKVAEIYNLPFVSFALKPLPFGFNRAAIKLKLKRKDCVIIGDQIFTDILGGNLAGMKTLLVEPIEMESGISIGIRRYFEKFVKQKL